MSATERRVERIGGPVTSPTSDQLTRIAELVAAGAAGVEMAEAAADEVQRPRGLSESGHTRGKIILTVGR
jgi:hypothetical protein